MTEAMEQALMEQGTTREEQLVVEELARRIERLLQNEGGAMKESRIISRFRGFAGPRTEALKPTAEEYSGGDASFTTYRLYLELLAEGTMKAHELPFRVATEREECPKVARPRRWEPRKGGPAKQAEAQTTQDTISHSMRRDIEERRTNGDAAWSTAKAQYVANLPTLAHKILHLLRRDGFKTEASLLPLAKAEDQPVPEALLKRTLQELGEAGKIRKMRERSTGRIVLDAFGKMPERKLETLLLGVMAEPKNGIPVPENTKLARRVAAFRKAKAGAKATPQVKGEAEREDWRGAEEVAPAGGYDPLIHNPEDHLADGSPRHMPTIYL